VQLRVAKFLMLGWNLLWIALLTVWLLNPDLESGKFSGGAPTTSPSEYPSTKPPDWMLFQFWFVGVVVLAGVWLATRWWAASPRRKPNIPHAD
jgi:hypothetical protein